LRYIKAILLILFFIFFFVPLSLAKGQPIEFTAAEKQFIKEHPVIRLGVDPQFVPYEFIDSDGQYKGIAADYMKLLSERTGIKLEVAPNLTWAQAYEKGVERQIDALPCVAKTKERQRYFLFSEPYYSFQRVIIVKDNNNSVNGLKDLFGKRVALKDQSSHYSYLKQFPAIKLRPYANEEEALKAVVDGRETIFVGNYANSSYIIKTNGYTNLKSIPINTEDKQYLYFASRSDWPILQSIINKGLASITREEKITIDNRWIGVQESADYTAIIRIVALVSAILAGIFLVSLFWILRLRKEVAERRRIEVALQSAKEEAEFANFIKSAFLARMSHEIRTPLNAITGMSYLMKNTGINATQELYLGNIMQAAQNMLRIINDILDFSKIEAGQIEIEKMSFNLDKLLQQVITLVSFKMDENGNRFQFSKGSHIPVYFWGDPTRLEQILLNVMNNAVKFTKAGSVTLDVRLNNLNMELYFLDFVIADTGIGMGPAELERLFKPFTQGDSSITRRFGGTGLGLSIVKSLVEAMGGDITVASSPGQGPTFTIHLPLEVDSNKERELKRRSTSFMLSTIRVLVLVRDTTTANFLSDYLRSFNMTPDFCDSGELTTEMLRNPGTENRHYHLLMVDNDSLPEGGLKFIKRIRQDDQIDLKPRIVLMIPIMREDVLAQIDDQDIDLVITKPIIPSILLDGILEIFGERVREAREMRGSQPDDDIRVDYPYHILVVEDNRTNQFIARSILEQAGFKVSLSDNGQNGVEFFEKNQSGLDLIVMDLHMPVMNGYEAAEIIKGIDPNMPIIAMTADAIKGVEEQCRRVGINRYISKPFEPEQFIAAIRDILKPLADKCRAEAAEKPPTAPEELLDENLGSRMAGNNRELYYLMLNEFHQESQGFLAELADLIDQKNYVEAAQLVHKIKGSVGNIGANIIWTLTTDLQKALQEDDELRITKLRAELIPLFTRLLEEIEQKIAPDKS